MNATRAIPAAAALAAVALLAVWWTWTPSRAVVPRVPEAERERLAAKHRAQLARLQAAIPTAADPPRSDGRIERLESETEMLPGAWPQFRGPQRDGICRDKTPLATTLPKEPNVLWSRPAGAGHAGCAVLNGRIYLLDYDVGREADTLRCLSLATGKDLWRYSYPVKVKDDHGMSRTVPAVTEKYIVTIGPKGHVTCLNTDDAMPRWQIDMARRFGTAVPKWHCGQCPLIDRGRAILAPAGNALLAAVDCESGKVVWHVPNLQGWRMTHSSVMPMEFAGRKMYVYCATGGVVGVDAEDGRLLWSTKQWRVKNANVPAPVPIGDGRILLSGDYDAGAMMIRLRPQGERFVPEILFRRGPREFSARHHTPILYKKHLYSIRQDMQLACMDLKGTVRWSSGAEREFNYGPFLIAADRIYAMDDNGMLSLIQATPKAYREVARVPAVRHEEAGEVLPAHEAWAPMALVAGRLLARDTTRLVCLDVRAPGP